MAGYVGGFLLGVLFGVAFATAQEFGFLAGFDSEGFVVFGAFLGNGHIVGRLFAAGLEVFLKDAFIVNQFVAVDRGLVVSEDLVFDEAGGGGDTAVQIDGADKRFDGVAEDGGFFGTS